MLIMQLKTSSEIRVPHAEVARYATYTEGNLASIELAGSAATRVVLPRVAGVSSRRATFGSNFSKHP
jgi:hypothetical protein